MRLLKRYVKNSCRLLSVSLVMVLCAVSFVCAAEVSEGQTAGNEVSQTVHWYDEAVNCVTEHGWMGMLEDGTFGAEKSMTRAMFVSALYEMDQEMETENEDLSVVPVGETDLPTESCGQSQDVDTEYSDLPGYSDLQDSVKPAKDLFGDVNGDEWFVPALEWAVEQKVINGINGNFCPDQTINREMMAVMIRRASSALSISSPADWSISIDYTDLEEVSDWAVDGIAFCAVYEIMSGNPDGSFAPKRELTRAEAAVILQRIDGLRQKADCAGCEPDSEKENIWKNSTEQNA